MTPITVCEILHNPSQLLILGAKGIVCTRRKNKIAKTITFFGKGFSRQNVCRNQLPQPNIMGINTYNEGHLHAALKEWYAEDGDQFEVEVDGYIVDLVRGNLLVEIQTANFTALKQKLARLLPDHPVRLVYPIAFEKWIVKLDEDLETRLSRRKSPKRGAVEHVFYELVRIPHLLLNSNFSLEILLIQEEEQRYHDGTRAWRRRGWVTHERYLLEVLERQLFPTPAALATLLPATLPHPFTTADLARALDRRRPVAQKMAYCLRKLKLLTPVGKQGNAILYERAGPASCQKDVRP